MRFINRIDAGQQLARALAAYREQDVVIYALPRGGVVVGAEVAQALHAPLELAIARKVGHPYNPEYAVCAVSESGALVCNERERAALDPAWLAQAVQREREEAARRRRYYLADREPRQVDGKTAIVIDDGIATGLTMRAAIQEIRERHPRRIVLAVPVIAEDTAVFFEREVDEVVAVERPTVFRGAVGAYYDQFPQVSDEEVIRLLAQL